MEWTQADVIGLIGLPIDDERVASFFDQRGLAQPKPAAATRPDSHTNSGPRSTEIKDKEWGLSYWFFCDVYNDGFPYVKQGRHYRTYFTQVDFMPGKTPHTSVLPTSFWNAGPAPNDTRDAFEQRFGSIDRDYEDHTIALPQSSHVDLVMSYLREQNRVRSYYATLVESFPFLDRYQLDEARGSYRFNQKLMLIRWLYERGFLLATAETDGASALSDRASLLAFVQTDLKGHLWENQLVVDPKLQAFLFASLSWERDYCLAFYDAWGQRAHYDGMKSIEQDAWECTIPLDAATYAVFKEALDHSYDTFVPTVQQVGLVTRR